MKELARGAAQSVDRQISRDDDGHRIEDGAIDIAGGEQDHFEQVVFLTTPFGQFTIDVFHHHDGTVDDDSKIDGAYRKEIGRQILRMQQDEAKEQSQGNGQGNDNGRANADQEKEQHKEHQNHPAEQIVFYGAGSQLHQVATVVKRTDFYVPGQDHLIQLVRLVLDPFQHVLRLLAAAHQDDTFDSVIVFLETELAEPRSISDHDLANVADPDRSSPIAAHHNVLDVLAVADHANPAHVVELSALRIESATGIGIVVRKRLHHLRDGHVEAINAGGVEQYLVLHDRAAEAGIIGNAGNGFVGALENPILNRLQVLGSAVGALDDVAVNQATGAEERGQAGRDAGGESYVGQTLEHDLPGKIIVGVLLESQPDIGESVERNGTHYFEMRQAVHFHFQGQRDQTLHLFGGVARPLRDQLHHGRREVRIGIYGHAVKGDSSPNRDHRRKYQHQKALSQGSLNNLMNHARPSVGGD